MLILLSGDIHGNFQFVHELFETALRSEADTIFALGDFGYWEHTENGRTFLDYVSNLATINNLPFHFLDGNHENHSLLRSTYGPGTPNGVTPEGFWPIRDNLYYSPRGNTWTWGDRKIMTLGGAYSIDINWRKPGLSWWPEEQIDVEEMNRAKAVGKVDIMLTHDCPSATDLQLMMLVRGVDYRNIEESEKNRRKIQAVLETAQPEFLYHGHYHVRHTQVVRHGNGTTLVKGLGCDGMGSDAMLLLAV